MIELTADTFNQEIKKYDLCLVDFYSSVCPPCKVLKKVLDHPDLSNIKIFGVNIDNYPELAVPYHVNCAPTLLKFKNGNVSDQYVEKPTLYAIKKFLKVL